MINWLNDGIALRTFYFWVFSLKGLDMSEDALLAEGMAAFD